MTAYPEPRPPAPTRPGPVSILLRLALGLLALAIPLFALWLATSLVLHSGAPLWIALTAGVLLVVVVPFAWDLWAEHRFLRRPNPPPRILARSDRVRLRILAICVGFSAFVVFAFGKPTTTALAQRGDWLLFGAQGSFAADVRQGIVGLSRGLASLTGTAPELAPAGQLAQTPSQTPTQPTSATPGLAPTPQADVTPTRPVTPPPTRAVGEPPIWPLPDEPHPAIRSMRDDVASLDEVASIIKSREADPFQRVKAIHDFAVQWVRYDTYALDPDYAIPSQDADAVFARRTGTCDGYVNLMIGLAKRTGDDLVRVVGRSRAGGTGVDSFYHSWVGATIDGKPYLIDPTWNAGAVFGREFRPRYSTSYLFTPPDIFAYDHLPNDPAWSLTEPPLTPELFLAKPVLTAHLFAWGLELQGVTAARTAVTGRIDFRIKNPRGAWVLVLARPMGDGTHGKAYNCVVPTQADPVEVGCALTPGPWQLELYANSTEGGRFPLIGMLGVDAR